MKTKARAPKGQATQAFDQLSLRGTNIRYYILPDNLNLDSLLVDLDDPKQKPGRDGRSVKQTASSATRPPPGG